MARRGPKPLYSDELAVRVLGGLQIGLTAQDAILAAGVSQDTVERWRQGKSGAPAEFADRYARARVGGVARRVSRLVELADAGDVRAIEAWLDRCAPEYRKTHKVEQSITVDVRRAAEAAAAELGVPVDVVLAETYRMVEESS